MFAVSGRALLGFCQNLLRLSQSKRCYSLFDENKLSLVKRVESPVSPDAKIYLETPMHIKILPIIDRDADSRSDKLILTVYSTTGEDKSPEFTIKRTQKRLDVIGNKQPGNSDDLCVIEAPAQASFDIQAVGNASIHLQRMLTPLCHIKTENGSAELMNMKGEEILVNSTAGSIKCEGSLHASRVDLRTGHTGKVFLNHILANNLRVSTHAGNIEAKSCYSEKSHLITAIGNMKLSALHSDCAIEVLQAGDVAIDGFEGTIRAILKRGNMSLQACKLLGKSNVFIHEKGQVDLLLDSNAEINAMELIAAQLQVEEEMKVSGTFTEENHLHRFRLNKNQEDDDSEVRLECRNGIINVKSSSWIEFVTNGCIKSEK